jgi:hypothetical protein
LNNQSVQKLRPTIKIKSPKRFRLLLEQQQKNRLNEEWTRSLLIEELYLSLMSVKEKDNEGIIRRKYEEIVRKEMYWMPIPPHSAAIVISLKDLDAKVKQELSKDDKISRDLVLKEAVGMICELVNSRFYLLSAKQYLKVRLEK